MAFVRDNQDTSSICMTAVQNLLDKYNIDPKDVGRLEGAWVFVAQVCGRSANFRPPHSLIRSFPQLALRA